MSANVKETQQNFTPFIRKLVSKRINKLPERMRGELLRSAEFMSNVGVNSQRDLKNFFYISTHLKKIATEISDMKISDVDMAKITSHVFNNLNYYPIDTIYNFYKAAHNAMRNNNIAIKKVAYPVGQGYYSPQSPHNINKWMQTMRDIYASVHDGLTFEQAFNKETEQWDKMEKDDYKHWLKFYQEGAQHKYKTAKDDFRLGNIPLSSLKAELPEQSDLPDMSQVRALEKAYQAEEKEKREAAIAKTKSIVSRLAAAEKLATDPQVLKMLRESNIDPDEWLEILHKLKRKIQLIKIKHASSTICEDLIAQRGNQLLAQGKAAGNLLLKIAQEIDRAPAPNEAEQQLEELGALPPEGSPQASTDSPPEELEEPEEDGAFDEIKRRMNNEWKDDVNDCLKEAAYILTWAEPIILGYGIEFKKFAQRPQSELVVNEDEEPDLVVEEDEEVERVKKPEESASDILQNVTLKDIVERLELVSNILKNREIPRQLGLIDLMMDKVNVASYFPNLAEAIKSALESNQYMSTRIEDILAKLRGSLDPTIELDLLPEETVRPGGLESELATEPEPSEPAAQLPPPEVAEPQQRPTSPAGEGMSKVRRNMEESERAPSELAAPARVIPPRRV